MDLGLQLLTFTFGSSLTPFEDNTIFCLLIHTYIHTCLKAKINKPGPKLLTRQSNWKMKIRMNEVHWIMSLIILNCRKQNHRCLA